jgi:hypothetical protein
MANDISRIIQVQISRQTATPSVESFSGILIADEFLSADITPAFTGRVRQYGSLAEVAAAGYAADSYVYLAASKIFGQELTVDRVYIGRKLTGVDGTETWTAALTAMRAENDDWYGVVVSTITQADQELVAQYVQSNKLLCVLRSADTDMVDTAYDEDTPPDIASYLKANALDRTGVFYSPHAGELTEDAIDAAMLGRAFPKDPGSITWALKTLAGVAVYKLTSAQITTLESKNANYYTAVGGINITQFGTTGTGEFFDVIHGMDWLTSTIQSDVYTPLVQMDKVPYTDGGVAVLENALKGALQKGVNTNYLESYTTAVPLVENISSSDIGIRLLPDMTFVGNLAGAIHKVQIVGTLTL